MPDEPGDGRRYERVAFLSSGTPDADRARDAYIARYGCAEEADADVVVASAATA